jgi:hypothetical protein
MNKGPLLNYLWLGSSAMSIKRLSLGSIKKTKNRTSREGDIPVFNLEIRANGRPFTKAGFLLTWCQVNGKQQKIYQKEVHREKNQKKA